jgi:hypothetical protein
LVAAAAASRFTVKALAQKAYKIGTMLTSRART